MPKAPSPKPNIQFNKAKSKEHVRTEPLWKGPEVDGVTQSQLGLFLICQERFRVKTIEGLGPPDSFRHRLEYGNMWHICEEMFGQGMAWEGPLKDYAVELCKKYKQSQADIEKWYETSSLPAFLITDIEGYKILEGGRIVGGLLVWICADGHNTF